MDFVGKKKLEGIIPALILPFKKNGKINFELLEKQVSYLVSSGINGLFVGEGK